MVRGQQIVSPGLIAYIYVNLPQSFGELKNITRVQNGDIHVDFRLAEVADTVRVDFHELQKGC